MPEDPAATSPDPSPRPIGMLEEPTLSRQWVIRRLQRALDREVWFAALRTGLGRRAPAPLGSVVAAQAAAGNRRAETLRQLIGDLGSVPYATSGAARPLGRAAGWLVAAAGQRAGRSVARRLAEHTLAEYRALSELIEDAPGVPADLDSRIRPLLDAAEAEAEAIGLHVTE